MRILAIRGADLASLEGEFAVELGHSPLARADVRGTLSGRPHSVRQLPRSCPRPSRSRQVQNEPEGETAPTSRPQTATCALRHIV